MSPIFRILTPFSRPQNLPALLEMWEPARVGARVAWHPILPCGMKVDFPGWVEPLSPITPPQDWDPCYFKLNHGMQELAAKSINGKFDWLGMNSGSDPARFGNYTDEYWGFLADDDTYDPGFFMRLSEFAGEEMLTVAARRFGADKTKPEMILKGHSPRVGHIGLEQFFVRREIIEPLRFENHPCADGLMVERIASSHGFAHFPELLVNFNKL